MRAQPPTSAQRPDAEFDDDSNFESGEEGADGSDHEEYDEDEDGNGADQQGESSDYSHERMAKRVASG